MQYQTFRGADVQEALFNVREALGADAMIESTRHVHVGSAGAGRAMVEITAAPSLLPPGQHSRPSAARTALNAVRARHAERTRARALSVATAQAAHEDLGATALGREIVQLRLMLDELSQGRPPRDRTRALLSAAGFEGALARTLGSGGTRAARSTAHELRVWLRERVSEKIACRSGLVEAPGRRLIACVGPSGVGKTTTLAKMAARATLFCKRRVRVISLDNFRVGAVEQWRRYAELIGFPFDVTPNAGAFHRVVHNNSEELLLVDTAGRSPSDPEASLPACLSGLRDLKSEVLLVLPAWLRARDAERAVQQYSPAPTGIVITKLDETDQVGGVMHAPLGSNLPLTYLCDGARVPEDIHDAAIDRVLDAIFPEQA
ncbi:MAG: flagellar biosis protein FlhF [Pseudomonadota bacterium]|jgi:flagellar biosynthesis protein FlhF